MSAAETNYARLVSERMAWAQEQRTALLAAIASTRDARSLMFADDEHDPDGSTASLDQARDTALLASTDRLLADLDGAQRRLVSGDYGRCELCDGEIDAGRLVARPETTVCIGCAKRRGRSRPA
ncbi:MAG TPA: TraR/DksA C4-type zinc finger protein [Microlunatus sp.]|nr:TraR/DksA C4-type zinc finger protein [Microlunatus sp.]